MSTRGLLAFCFNGRHYVTYNHSDSYPKGLGAGVCRFAAAHLHSPSAIEAFGRKLEALEWVDNARDGEATRLQGGELLAAIAQGEVRRVARENLAFTLGGDREFAYILDLDQGRMEFWDLFDGGQAATFDLETLSSCAVDVMECERRH
ncbi:hypothetical protein [Mesoterricola silvestris]|uniref:Uncharacterized protein n=1 Tax=Mesoterricola silvestris TaxID=2927979 RepID=A0AA48GT98_9BACT|nr:hypothetical protein [Mesoterricola silvestris]BDU71341.1 hypothetical protein METEAL_05150 [Mesoterricola silvestris]